VSHPANLLNIYYNKFSRFCTAKTGYNINNASFNIGLPFSCYDSTYTRGITRSSKNIHIFISSGTFDPIVLKQEAERLFGLFKKACANASHLSGKIVAMN
jgi:hypothetical protein